MEFEETFFDPEEKPRAEMLTLKGGPLDGETVPVLEIHTTITTPVYDGTRRLHWYVRRSTGFKYAGVRNPTEEEERLGL
jgi:hypothetical protein